ncbi:DUF547 domain-containing protein [Desulfoluna butyratoxydans]|uniref:DUF547 domain-containing protein n=1 Tax=Desulfoluna butyratoxydans TaxID=231438 RepID=A0A4U8YRH5_9BACT|nr:DUF547 domain-containing protein [Desulfoluna butyratoxydans]VFQ45919.1 domain of unknown function duf547 [Desulfoluna butyratoxydans]
MMSHHTTPKRPVHPTRHHTPKILAQARPGPSPTLALWAVLLMALVFALVTGARAETYDHAPFDDLLATHVRGGGIDYDGLADEEDKLDAYLAPAASYSAEGLSREEAMAFWINMYNAWTLKLILTKYPEIESIKDLGSVFSSPWKKEFVKIGGKTLTLNEIEHAILREKYQDPRIHFAVNCASRSCPPLLAEAYLGDTLDAQLDAATIDFINNSANTRVEGNRLVVSRIFKWYKEDFGDDIAAYIGRYAEGPLKAAMAQAQGDLKVSFMAYDWSLNVPDA